MKIYKVSTFRKPAGSKFLNFAQLNCRKADMNYLDSDHFSGLPFPKKWRPVKLYFENPLWPRADFYNFSIGKIVCTTRAKELTSPALSGAGEFLPITIEGEQDEHFIFNVTNVAKVDSKKSLWEYYEPVKLDMGLISPAFNATGFGRKTVFKISEDCGADIYCLEQKSARYPELKALAECHKLTGLEFELIWSDTHGPTPLRKPPTMSGMIWKTGDGTVYRSK